MLNSLNFDFYKITKSRNLRLFFNFAVILCFLNPVINYVAQKSGHSVLWNLWFDNVPQLLVAVFSVLFVSMDFASGFIANVYRKSDKTTYVLSKIIYIFLFTVAVYLEIFLIDVIFDKIFSEGKFIGAAYTDNLSVWETARMFICKFSGAFVFGCIVALFTMAVKSPVVALIALMAYMFVGDPVLNLLNSVVGNGFSIQTYTVFGGMNRILSFSTVEEIKKFIIILIVYFVVSVVGGILLIRRKNY